MSEYLPSPTCRRALGLAIACIAALAAGCGGARLPAAAELSRAPEEVAMLDQGRSLYVERCGTCHRLHSPASLSAEKWPGRVASMAKRAKIDAVQQELITAYLVKARTTPVAP